MNAVYTAQKQTVLTHLFAQYVAGQIADTHWTQLADSLDEATASPDERAAFAAFYLDAANDPAEELRLPRPHEVSDILQIVRS